MFRFNLFNVCPITSNHQYFSWWFLKCCWFQEFLWIHNDFLVLSFKQIHEASIISFLKRVPVFTMSILSLDVLQSLLFLLIIRAFLIILSSHFPVIVFLMKSTSFKNGNAFPSIYLQFFNLISNHVHFITMKMRILCFNDQPSFLITLYAELSLYKVC